MGSEKRGGAAHEHSDGVDCRTPHDRHSEASRSDAARRKSRLPNCRASRPQFNDEHNGIDRFAFASHRSGHAIHADQFGTSNRRPAATLDEPRRNPGNDFEPSDGRSRRTSACDAAGSTDIPVGSRWLRVQGKHPARDFALCLERQIIRPHDGLKVCTKTKTTRDSLVVIARVVFEV